jgi:hypothetical protein
METQNYRPPDEKELTFSAYGYFVCNVMFQLLCPAF